MADDTDMTDATAAPAADPSQDTGSDDSTTLVTICKKADGTYVVYAGDEPEPDDTEGGEGAEANATPADSVGGALKAALDILKADENGDEQGDFQAGFDGGSSASPPKAPAAPAPGA